MREFEPKGKGGAPLRATTLPPDAESRKGYPVASGVLDYFPDALVAVAEVSKHGNDQHNPRQPLHWDRSKSGDEADTLARHLLQRGLRDTDGLRHSAKMAWRALALLQKEIEGEKNTTLEPRKPPQVLSWERWLRIKTNGDPYHHLLWCTQSKSIQEGCEYWPAYQEYLKAHGVPKDPPIPFETWVDGIAGRGHYKYCTETDETQCYFYPQYRLEVLGVPK